jgi:carboxymethylenebutenolidase
MIDLPNSGARAYLAQPGTTPAPGVLVLHAWWGFTPFFEGVCDRLAQAGFVALAPDLYEGDTTDTIEGAEALRGQHPNERLDEIANDALSTLRANPAVSGPVAVLGFSLGAAWAAVLATERPEDVRAAVVMYGAYTGLDHSPARAAYLGHFGEQDDMEPLDGVREMESEIRAGGRDVTFYVYPDAQHWFMENDRPEYRPADAELAWERTLAFLAQQLEAGA